MVVKCINIPQRRRIRTFKARDVGRIILHARQDGESQVEIIAYILYAFGFKEVFCFVLSIVTILNRSLFLSAFLTILKGVINIMKAIKIGLTGKSSPIKAFIEFMIPKRFLGQWGRILLFIGAIEIMAGGLLVFVTSIANNLDLVNWMRGVCDVPIRPVNLPTDFLPLGSIFKTMVDFKIMMEDIERLRREAVNEQ